MKPNLSSAAFTDPELKKLISILVPILSNLNLDNMQYRTIQGSTDSAPNTSRRFPHGMNPRPYEVTFQAQDGGCYVYSIGNDAVDIRSTQSGATFTALLKA